MGFLDGLFGGSSGPDTQGLTDEYSRRLSAIADYQRRLEGASRQYRDSLSNLNQTVFNLYAPNAAAQFGANGLGTNSGAFSAALARQAALLEAEGAKSSYQQDISNLSAVESERGSAWGNYFSAKSNYDLAGWHNKEQNKRAVGQLVGQVAMAGIGAAMPWSAGATGLAGFGQRWMANLGYGAAMGASQGVGQKIGSELTSYTDRPRPADPYGGLFSITGRKPDWALSNDYMDHPMSGGPDMGNWVTGGRVNPFGRLELLPESPVRKQLVATPGINYWGGR